MEVKIGVQHVARELNIDTTLDADGVEAAVSTRPRRGRGPRPHRREGTTSARPRRQGRLRRHLHQRDRSGRLQGLTRRPALAAVTPAET